MSNLKRLRTNKNITQAQLSELSGVSVRVIQNYEQGIRDINKAQANTVLILAKALGCTIEEILNQ